MRNTKAIRRTVVILLAGLLALSLGITAALAGSPHFVGSPTVTQSGNTVTVTWREAGLGGEDQVTATVGGTFECINGGDKHPKATNKETVSNTSTQPVQNGQLTGSVTLTATLSCDPPMTLVFVNGLITDTTNGISLKF